MCTSIRFTDNSGHMYLGRNLDWSFDYGQQVRVMPRGFHIPYSFIDDATAAHAVIGMCIDYRNYPMFFDCGNDAGLAVAGLNFPGYAEYAEDPVDGKTNIAAYEFPLWVAATFSTVDEVEAALRDTVIVAKSAGEGLGVSLLHWIIGDRQHRGREDGCLPARIRRFRRHPCQPADLPVAHGKPAHLYHCHKRFSADGDMAWRRAQALWRGRRHARYSG